MYKPYQVEWVKKIKRNFNQVECYSFNEAINYPGGPVMMFLKLLNLNTNAFTTVKANVSPSMEAIRLLEHITHSDIVKNKEKNTISDRDVRHICEITGSQFTLLRHEIEPLYTKLLEEKDMLEKEGAIQFQHEPPLETFPQHFMWGKESLESLAKKRSRLSPHLLGCVDNWSQRRRSAAEGPRNPGNGQIEIRILMH